MVDFLQSIPILSQCSSMAVERLAGSVRGSLYHRHTRVWQADSPADCVYVVVSGTVNMIDEYPADEWREEDSGNGPSDASGGVESVHRDSESGMQTEGGCHSSLHTTHIAAHSRPVHACMVSK